MHRSLGRPGCRDTEYPQLRAGDGAGGATAPRGSPDPGVFFCTGPAEIFKGTRGMSEITGAHYQPLAPFQQQDHNPLFVLAASSEPLVIPLPFPGPPWRPARLLSLSRSCTGQRWAGGGFQRGPPPTQPRAAVPTLPARGWRCIQMRGGSGAGRDLGRAEATTPPVNQNTSRTL